MNLGQKLRKEREVLNMEKSIEKAKQLAVYKKVNKELENISNIEFAEWFLTEFKINGVSIYYNLSEYGKIDFNEDKVYIRESLRKNTKISHLIYSSSHINEYITKDMAYVGEGCCSFCLGKKSISKIKDGLKEMDINVSYEHTLTILSVE